MNRCLLCGNEFKIWEKIDGKYRNLCSRKFCLECSPFGKHNTKKTFNLRECNICGCCDISKHTNNRRRMIKGKRVNVCEDCYIPMKEYKPWNKGMTVDSNPEIKEKLIAGGESTKSKYESGEILPRVLSEEEREKLSLIKKEYYKKYPEKHPCRILAKNKKLGSYPERLCMDYLDSMGIKYEYNKSVYPYYPDFMFDNIILEVDGYYWHTDKEKDKKRDEYLTNAGYTVFRIPAKNVIEHLKKFVNDVIINNHQGVG